MNKEQAIILNKQITVSTKMSLGIRDMSFGENGLTFKCLRSRYITIQLNGLDLYDIRFFRIKRAPSWEQITITQINNIYAEDLNEILYNITHHTEEFV